MWLYILVVDARSAYNAMQLRAVARITMSPIVETLPCVGGVTITLLKVRTAARCNSASATTRRHCSSAWLTCLSPSLQAPYFDASFSMASGPDIMALPFIHEAVRIATKVQSCLVWRQLSDLPFKAMNPHA